MPKPFEPMTRSSLKYSGVHSKRRLAREVAQRPPLLQASVALLHAANRTVPLAMT